MKAVFALFLVLAYVMAVIHHLAKEQEPDVGVHIPSVVVEAKVREYFADIPILVKIAWCESTFRHTEENGEVLRGRVNPLDTGVMQINLKYHRQTLAKHGLDAARLEDNLRYARYLYGLQGTQPWRSSAHCWG